MLHVVILDENVPIRELLAEWLTGEGHCVHEPPPLPNQAMALRSEIDLVLLDLPSLREGAGPAIARARERFARAWLVGLSTQLAESLPQRSAVAQSLGLQALLAKPCERAELLGLIRELGTA